MMFPDSKNVIFIKFLLRLNFSTIKSGLPDFYRVKLDVIGFGQKPHFWNRETSYSNTLYLVSEGENIALLPIVKNYREILVIHHFVPPDYGLQPFCMPYVALGGCDMLGAFCECVRRRLRMR